MSKPWLMKNLSRKRYYLNNRARAILLKEKELVLASSERNIQELQSGKNRADFIAQKAETEKKQSQLEILNKEKDIQHCN